MMSKVKGGRFFRGGSWDSASNGSWIKVPFFLFYLHFLLAHLVWESFCRGGANKYWFQSPEIQIFQTGNTSIRQREISQLPIFFCEWRIVEPAWLRYEIEGTERDQVKDGRVCWQGCLQLPWVRGMYQVGGQQEAKRIQNHLQDNSVTNTHCQEEIHEVLLRIMTSLFIMMASIIRIMMMLIIIESSWRYVYKQWQRWRPPCSSLRTVEGAGAAVGTILIAWWESWPVFASEKLHGDNVS